MPKRTRFTESLYLKNINRNRIDDKTEILETEKERDKRQGLLRLAFPLEANRHPPEGWLAQRLGGVKLNGSVETNTAQSSNNFRLWPSTDRFEELSAIIKTWKKFNPIVGGDFASSLGTSDNRSVAQALGLFSKEKTNAAGNDLTINCNANIMCWAKFF